MKVPTPAKQLKAGDTVDPQGLVIAVEHRYDRIGVTFKGLEKRTYPNDQLVQVLIPDPVVPTQ